MAFMDRLLLLMENNHLSAYRLAKEIGIHESSISKWQKKPNPDPSVSTILKLCEYFHVSVEWLLTGKEDNQSSITQNKSDNEALSIDERLLLKYYRDMQEEQRIELQQRASRIAAFNKTKQTKSANTIDKKSIPSQMTSRPQTKMRIYNEKASAGLGNYLNAYDNSELISFYSDEIPDRADFGVRILGDSMEPDIQDDSIVWVEEKASIDDGDIGIFVLDGEAYCKELCIDHKKRRVLLVSTNEQYRPIEVKEHNNLRTIGKVLF